MFLTPTDAARAVALVQDGRSQYYAADVLGVSRSAVQRAVQRFNETGNFTRRPGSGRRRTTSERDDRFLVTSCLRNRHNTSVQLANRLNEVRNVDVSRWTVRRRLAEAHLVSRRPALCPLLSVEHRRARLAFAREHENWNDADWRSVLFSDESRFSLRSPDGRERVWRRQGERFAQCNIAERISYRGGSVMIWGGISYEARTDLAIVDGGSMTGARYITTILDEHVIPFAPFIGPNFLFMDDNARPHRARIVNDYLEEVGIVRMNWPACSPDLNPIEHLWDIMGRQYRARIPCPHNLAELGAALQEIWRELDQTDIHRLISSMPRRIQAVIRARGGNTRY